jgi:hypothetical protein
MSSTYIPPQQNFLPGMKDYQKFDQQMKEKLEKLQLLAQTPQYQKLEKPGASEGPQQELPAFKAPTFKQATFSDFAKEASKIYGQFNQGTTEQRLQPMMDYIKTQLPELSKQFVQNTYGKNVGLSSGVGGQIAGRQLSDFQNKVLSPVVASIAQQTAADAPEQQMKMAFDLEAKDMEQKDKDMRQLLVAIEQGRIKEDAIIPTLSEIYKVDPSILKKPEVQKQLLDSFIQTMVLENKRTPSFEEVNKVLESSGQPPLTREQYQIRMGSLSENDADDLKVSSLINKLNSGALNRDTAESYGIPKVVKDNWSYGFNNPSWDYLDTPETREAIKNKYKTDENFRAWFDQNA